jgi:serine/threonine protein phosphatase PrpC
VTFDPLAPKIDVEFFGITDVGRKRKQNEDNFVVGNLQTHERAFQKEHNKWRLGGRGIVFGVCDGMGGAAAGEVASEMAVENLFEGLLDLEPALEPHVFGGHVDRAIQTANHRIFDLASKDPSKKGMGTTVSAAVTYGNILFLAQVGDSRAYLFRGGKLIRVTKDQSLLERLIEEGAISPEHAENFVGKNVILQALGPTPQVLVDLKFIELEANDVVMLCSDGLHGPVLDDQLESILTQYPDVRQAGQALIDAANRNGGPDNITAIVIRYTGQDLPAPATPTEAIPQPVKYVRAPIDAITLRLEKELGAAHWLNKHLFATPLLIIYGLLLVGFFAFSVWSNRDALHRVLTQKKKQITIDASVGRVVVASDMPNAMHFVNDRPIGQMHGNGGRNLILSVGSHKIYLLDRKWKSKVFSVNVKKNRTRLLEIFRSRPGTQSKQTDAEWLPGRDAE